MKYDGLKKKLPDLAGRRCRRTSLPAGTAGSHGFLMNEFVASILEDRKPMVDVVAALNMTVAGVVAHQSALEGRRTDEDTAVCSPLAAGTLSAVRNSGRLGVARNPGKSVILSAAKNLRDSGQILRCAQNDETAQKNCRTR